MSDQQKWPYDQALAVAKSIVISMAPLCDTIEIAGSLRRKKETVGDIELVYIPKMAKRPIVGDMFAEETYSVADELLDFWLKDRIITKRLSKTGVPTWGKENKLAVHAESRIPVDFFATDAERWYVALVIRTGSKETNLRLTTGANRLGRHLHAYGAGVSERGNLHRCYSERDVFKLCGVYYLEPEKR